MVTVVIPLFNKEQFIAEAIQSVLQQTFTAFELIIVDDGSIDGSVHVVEGFSDARIRLISIPNSGVSIARNTGIESATYNWVAFLDADDWWAPMFLEEMLNAIHQFEGNRIFASGRSRVFKGSIERYQHSYLPNEGATEVINYYKVIRQNLSLINSSNVVIDKALFKERGFFRRGQKKHEDHDLWLRLCVNEEVVFVNKELSFYRKTELNSGSTSGYDAIDFSMYLETLLSVGQVLTEKENKDFKIYYNKFVLLTYIKNYWHFTKEERKHLFTCIEKLLSKKSLWILQFINIMPFNVYVPLKLLKR